MQQQLTLPAFGDDRLPPRFWSKVRVLNNGCWEWVAYRHPNGYGRFFIGSHTDGSRRQVQAHRVAYGTLIGPIPDGLESDHLCRNRACVNPAHIEPVTRSENNRRRTWTGCKGEANGQHKLTEDDVRAIRDLRGEAVQRVLAAQFDVSRQVISHIQRRKAWRHV